jgi:hypothetical protein
VIRLIDWRLGPKIPFSHYYTVSEIPEEAMGLNIVKVILPIINKQEENFIIDIADKKLLKIPYTSLDKLSLKDSKFLQLAYSLSTPVAYMRGGMFGSHFVNVKFDLDEFLVTPADLSYELVNIKKEKPRLYAVVKSVLENKAMLFFKYTLMTRSPIFVFIQLRTMANRIDSKGFSDPIKILWNADVEAIKNMILKLSHNPHLDITSSVQEVKKDLKKIKTEILMTKVSGKNLQFLNNLFAKYFSTLYEISLIEKYKKQIQQSFTHKVIIGKKIFLADPVWPVRILASIIDESVNYFAIFGRNTPYKNPTDAIKLNYMNKIITHSFSEPYSEKEAEKIAKLFVQKKNEKTGLDISFNRIYYTIINRQIKRAIPGSLRTKHPMGEILLFKENVQESNVFELVKENLNKRGFNCEILPKASGVETFVTEYLKNKSSKDERIKNIIKGNVAQVDFQFLIVVKRGNVSKKFYLRTKEEESGIKNRVKMLSGHTIGVLYKYENGKIVRRSDVGGVFIILGGKLLKKRGELNELYERINELEMNGARVFMPPYTESLQQIFVERMCKEIEASFDE